MSARSPRGSLSGNSDVALDFADALKDLQQNNRLEILNLTTIARESTEQAQAISTALEDHIRAVSQQASRDGEHVHKVMARRLTIIRSGLHENFPHYTYLTVL